MKKLLYIVAFTFLGLVVSTVLHAVVELAALAIIFGNPEQFASSFWWQEWELVHRIGGGTLWVAGFFGGLYLGIKWWEPYGSQPGFFLKREQNNNK